MADNKNFKLDDEMMSNAAGGSFEPITPYSIGDRVLLRGSEGEAYGTIVQVYVHDEYMVSYDVQLDNEGSLVPGVPHFLINIV